VPLLDYRIWLLGSLEIRWLLLAWLLNPNLLEENIQDGVGPTGVLVHAGLINLPTLHALLHEIEELLLRLHMDLCQPLDENPSLGVFTDLEASVRGLGQRSDLYTAASHRRYGGIRRHLSRTSLPSGGRGPLEGPGLTSSCPRLRRSVEVEQVRDLLHVNLEERDGDSELALDRVPLDVLEHVVHRPRHQPILELGRLVVPCLQLGLLGLASEDSVGLAAAGLAVGHDDAVESIQDILHDGLGYLFVAFLLGGVCPQDAVEEEVSIFILGPHEREAALRPRVHLDAFDRPLGRLRHVLLADRVDASILTRVRRRLPQKFHVEKRANTNDNSEIAGRWRQVGFAGGDRA